MAQSKDDNPKPRSDERNLVDAAAASGADLEDQLALIWERNKKFIIYCIAGVFVVFGIYHFSKFMVAQAEASLKEDYASADDSASRLAFAERESSNPLGGFAYSELAGEAYESGDFPKAADYYSRASKSAKGAIRDAALMGQAISLLQSGESGQARGILEDLASNEEAGNATEARYRLAELAIAEEDFDVARNLITEIQTNFSQETFYWIQKAMSLQSKLPPLESAVADQS
jgi:tetratricopeptide (TPR) repeat protein